MKNKKILLFGYLGLAMAAAYAIGYHYEPFAMKCVLLEMAHNPLIVGLSIMFIAIVSHFAVIIGQIKKESQGKNFPQRNIGIICFSLLFILSSAGGIGGFQNNTFRVYNVMLFGAKGDGTTDDTPPIQSAVNAAASAGGGTVYLPANKFLVAGSPSTSIGGMTNNNGIIYLPYAGSESTAYTVTIQGEAGGSPGNMVAAPLGTTIPNNTGTRIYCTYAGSQSTTLGNIAVFGTGLVSGVLNFNTLVCKDLQIIVKNNPNGAGPEMGGISMKNAQGILCYDISINVDTIPTATTLPTRNVIGIETPDNNYGATYPILNSSVSCLRWGFVFGEHVSGDYLSSTMCFYGFGMKQGNHASHYGRLCSQWTTNDIAYYYPQSGTTSCVFNIEQLDIEHIAGLPGHWYSTHAFAVNDSLNLFQASLNYEMVTSFIGQDNASFTVNGATGVSTLPISTPLWFSNTNGTAINSNSGFTTFTSANVYIKLNETSGTGNEAIVYTANGTNKWQEGMDFGFNGTFDRYTYNVGTGKLNAYYTPAGDVSFGFDALNSPTLKLQATGGLGAFLNASAIPTGSSSDSLAVLSISSGVLQVKAIAQSTLAVPWDATLSVNNTTAREVIITGSPSTRPNMRIGDNLTATSINSSVQHIFGNVVDSSGFKTITTGPGSGIVFVSGGFLFKTFGTANAGSTPTNNQSFVGDSNWNVGIGGRITTLVEPLNTYLPGSTATFGDNSVFFAAKAIPTGSTSDSVFVGTISSGVLQLKAVAQSSIVGATPTLQQVLTAGSTLTSANTVISSSNQLTISASTFLSQQNSTAAFGSIVSATGAKSWTFGYLTNNTSQANGSAIVVDSNNNVSLQSGGGAVQYTSFRGGVAYASSNTITSGTSSTIANAIINTYINPASLIAAYTLTLPSAPLDGTLVQVFGGGTITGGGTVVTAFTISANSGQTITQGATGVTTLLAGACYIYQYNASDNSWYRKQ